MMNRLRRMAWPLMVVLLPLALMAWSSLQSWRASNVLEEAQVMQQWLANPSDELLQRLSYAERTQAISAQGRRDQFAWKIREAQADRPPLLMRKALAWLAYWLALAALLAGPGTWIKLRMDAWRALKSQQYLYNHLSQSWHVIGRWLVAYTGLLVAAIGTSLLYELSYGWSHLKGGGWAMALVAIPVLGVMGIGIMLIVRLRKRWQAMDTPMSSVLGRGLSRSEAPGVWAWVEALASKLDAPMPDHIVVGVDQSFFVTCVNVTLQPSGQTLSGRTMYLPLPYLCTLSQAETAAIIGHELGHFNNRDTERGSEVSAHFRLMCEHFELIRAQDPDPSWIERPAIWITAQFLLHFQLAVHHWGRAEELLADRSAAKIAGTRLFAQALLRVIALESEIRQLLDDRQHGNVLQALAEHLQRTPMRLDDQVLEHTVNHPFDTHPATALRLRHLQVEIDAELLAQATRTPREQDRQWFGQLTQAPAPSNIAGAWA